MVKNYFTAENVVVIKENSFLCKLNNPTRFDDDI